jgi:hypothetical protein
MGDDNGRGVKVFFSGMALGCLAFLFIFVFLGSVSAYLPKPLVLLSRGVVLVFLWPAYAVAAALDACLLTRARELCDAAAYFGLPVLVSLLVLGAYFGGVALGLRWLVRRIRRGGNGQ